MKHPAQAQGTRDNGPVKGIVTNDNKTNDRLPKSFQEELIEELGRSEQYRHCGRGQLEHTIVQLERLADIVLDHIQAH